MNPYLQSIILSIALISSVFTVYIFYHHVKHELPIGKADLIPICITCIMWAILFTFAL